jgi:hypothetical protein
MFCTNRNLYGWRQKCRYEMIVEWQYKPAGITSWRKTTKKGVTRSLMPCTYPEAGWRIAQMNKILSNISWTIFCWNRAIKGLIRGMSMWIWKHHMTGHNIFTLRTKVFYQMAVWLSGFYCGLTELCEMWIQQNHETLYTEIKTIWEWQIHHKSLPICPPNLQWT